MSFQIPPLDIREPSLDAMKRVLTTNGITIDKDEEQDGFISFYYGNWHCFYQTEPFQQVYCPISCYEDTDLKDREPFDAEFVAIRQNLIAALGQPSEIGHHVYSHRPRSHYYMYSVWQLEHSRLALAQDEFDIQFGLDLSLRFLYKLGPAETRIYELSDTPAD